MSEFRDVVFSPISPVGEGVTAPGQLGVRSVNNGSPEGESSSTVRLKDRLEDASADVYGGQSSVYGASFNFVNSIVGAGIIAIPDAIQQCGLLLGVFMLLLVAYLVNQSVLMLIECGIRAKKFDLEELAEHLLGRNGYYFALLFMFMFGYGAQIAYLVIIGDTIPKAAELLFPGTVFSNRQATLLLCATLIVLPICLIRDLSSLSWTSLLSITVDALIVLVVFGACLTLRSDQDEHFTGADVDEVNRDVFAGVGTMSFAFVCQHNSFMVFRSLRNPSYGEWKQVAGLSVGSACALCLTFGLVGFFSFYPYVQGDLLNNFPVKNVAIATARLFLAITMFFTYPMECYVTRHCIVAFWNKYQQNHAHVPGQQRAQADDSVATVADGATNSVGVLGGLLTAADSAVHSALHAIGGGHSHRDSSTSTGGNPGQHGYRNVQGGTHGEAGQSNEEDVTIMFMENKVLMLYDVSIDDSGDGDSGAQSSGAQRAVGHAEPSIAYRQARTHSQQPLNPIVSSGAGSGTVPRMVVNSIREGSDSPIFGEAGGSPRIAGGGGDKYIAPQASLPVHVTLTLLLWSSSLAIALVFRQLGVVSALTGAVAASMLGFVLPAALYIKTYEHDFRRACRQGRALLQRGGTDVHSDSGTEDADGMEGGGRRGGYRQVHSSGSSGHGEVSMVSLNGRQAGAALTGADSGFAEEDDDMEVTVTFDGGDDSPTGTRTGSHRQAPPVARSTLSVLSELHRLFRSFYLSLLLMIFGFMALIIGVTTVLYNQVQS